MMQYEPLRYYHHPVAIIFLFRYLGLFNLINQNEQIFIGPGNWTCSLELACACATCSELAPASSWRHSICKRSDLTCTHAHLWRGARHTHARVYVYDTFTTYYGCGYSNGGRGSLHDGGATRTMSLQIEIVYLARSNFVSFSKSIIIRTIKWRVSAIMASAAHSSKEWLVESYMEQQEKVWPNEGRYILAQYDEDSIVVYQAYCPEIADYAVKHQKWVH